MFMNIKITLTYHLRYLSYSHSVEANMLEEQQAPGIIGSKLVGLKYLFEGICANSQANI